MKKYTKPTAEFINVKSNELLASGRCHYATQGVYALPGCIDSYESQPTLSV
jgi:hypothetical protein